MIPTTDMSADKGDEKSSDHDELVTKIVEKLKDASDEDLAKVAEALKMDQEDPNAEPAESDIPKVIKPAGPMIDTSALTGPRANLKSLLMKKSMDNSDTI